MKFKMTEILMLQQHGDSILI